MEYTTLERIRSNVYKLVDPTKHVQDADERYGPQTVSNQLQFTVQSHSTSFCNNIMIIRFGQVDKMLFLCILRPVY